MVSIILFCYFRDMMKRIQLKIIVVALIFTSLYLYSCAIVHIVLNSARQTNVHENTNMTFL